MSRALIFCLLATDTIFILYWLVNLCAFFGLITLPAALMYDDYQEAKTSAWNWSFLPLDLGFSIIGLLAVRAHRAARHYWRILVVISLTLTMAAGLMAISYWTILGEFDLLWFVPNLVLFMWPLFFLPKLIIADSARGHP
jgi:hypothetical protein